MKEKVSIGLPVYNGEKSLAIAIESLLSQDYTNFELIISDNASTDQTESICQKYAKMDKRIKYSRNASNMGAIFNFNRVFSLATSSMYFMWTAHDDIWDPGFIRKCYEKLQEKESIVLCSSDIQYIDESGHEISNYSVNESKNIDTVGMDILDRIRMQFTRQDLGVVAVYGLIRTSFLKRTQMVKSIYGADIPFISELLLMGEFARVPEKLYYRRMPAKPKQTSDFCEDIFGKKEVVIHYPITGIFKEIINNIERSNMTLCCKKTAQEIVIKTLCFDNSCWRDQIFDEYPNAIGPFFPNAELIQNVLAEIISGDLQNIDKYTNDLSGLVDSVLGDRQVLIWGAGSNGQRAQRLFEIHGYKDRVVGFLDTDLAKGGTKFCGLPVFTPQFLINGHFNNIPFILISSMYADEIENQLSELGFVEKKDYLRRFSIIS